MLSKKKVNIPRAVYDQWIVDLCKVAAASVENIEIKFKNSDKDIFTGEAQVLYDTISQMTPEALEILRTMKMKYAWLLRHSINVAVLSLLIAHLLCFNKQEKQKLLTGALLHDVGKMVISGAILQKPAALTEDEMTIMHRHPLSGYHMVMNSSIPEESKLIVLQHHERLDGSGYPDNLKEAAISQGAKIVMVADSLDAMTSFRPYRTAQSMPNALKSIRNDGSKYDQTIISSLRHLLPQNPLSIGVPITPKVDYHH